MASTAADIIASAKAEAEAARQSAMSSLSGMTTDLTNAYNQQQAATTAGYQNTLNQLQNAYQRDAKAAYGNYMSERQNLNNQLTRLGLQNSGYGVSQELIAGAGYSKNLAGLQSALSTNTANTNVQQQQALADLYNTYARNKLSADQFAYEAGQNAYDRMYSNVYQARQDEIANALQQQYYNYLMSQGRGGGGYSSGGGGSRSRNSKNNNSNDDIELTEKTNNPSAKKGISIKVTDTGKNLTDKLSGLKNFAGGTEIMKKELQNQYNKGKITAGDVNFAINRLKLR